MTDRMIRPWCVHRVRLTHGSMGAWAALLLIFLCGCESVQEEAPAPPPAPVQATNLTRAQGFDGVSAAEFDPHAVLAHAVYLASEKLEGRQPATEGCRLARDYIVERFRKWGLEPGGVADGDKRSYVQPFEFVSGVQLGKATKLTFLAGGKDEQVYKLEADFVPLRMSGSLKDEQPVELVFAGYAISDPKNGYDDFAGLEVKDKVVVALRGEPETPAGKRIGKGEADPHAPPSVYSDLFYKVATARDQGARALLVTTGFRNTTEAEREALLPFAQGGRVPGGLPALQARTPVVADWFRAAGLDLEALQKLIDAELKPQSRAMAGVRVSLAVEIERTRASTENVLGVLPGTDPVLKDEIIVLGAHYDHLGRGNEFSLADKADLSAKKIHFGADDNASGTAVLLELARALGEQKAALKRTVWFMAFSAEELGTLGSLYLVKEPPAGLEVKRIAAMVNLDMVGRLREEKLHAIGAGTGQGFDKLLEAVNAPYGFTIKTTEDGFGGSDHLAFVNHGVPVLFFFTGSHTDYHKPTDTADKLNAPGMAKIGAFVFDTAARLIQAPQRPAYVKIEPKSRPVMGMGGVRLGTLPDYSFEGKGLRLQGVRGGGPADKAGLKQGDTIILLAGKRIETIQDFMNVLRQCKPGEPIEIVVIREGQEVKLTATPEQG
ncbi:MAG: M20/M25/M40 family metallo-hydrolase [Planctomycetes bacterium]|nr:M20/M25/M40 family metallo-hydrolase [Planctomycetota bacterium]